MPESMETFAATFALCATIWLSLGLVLSQVTRRRPARAHGVLVAALIGTLATPVLYFGFQQANWGLLSSRQERISLPALNRKDPSPRMVAADATQAPLLEVPRLESASVRSMEENPVDPAFRLPEGTERARTHSGSIPGQVPDLEVTPYFTWRSQLFWVWFAASVLFLLRLCLDFLIGHRLARMSRPLDVESSIREIESFAQKLGLTSAPHIALCDQVASPVLWGWSRPARILVSAKSVASPDFPGVYLHELAHLARRDHLSALVGEIVRCLIPWHPLVWWAKRTMEARAEEACDDWAIACGCDPLDYADELVNLAPSRRSTLTMAAVSKTSSLKQRVSRLIRGSFASPRLGRGWVMGLGLIAILLASGFALIQPREVRAEAREVIPLEPAVEGREAIPFEPTIEGTLALAPVPITENRWTHQMRVHAKGKPVPGAKVWIEEYRDENNKMKQFPIGGFLKTNEFGIVVVNQYIPARNGIGISYAEDEVGRFGTTNVIYGEGSITYIEITPTRPIRGRVVHEGKPLSGVSCQLVSFKRLDQRDGFFQDYPFPLYREAPRSRTDEKGEFSFQGIPDGFAGTVLLDKDGLGLAKVSILGGENPTIELAKAGELQVNFPGEGGAARLREMYWFVKDLNESTKSWAPLRISYGRIWWFDSIREGKVLRLGPGKYRFYTQHKGTDRFDTGDPVDFVIEPGKTTAITLGAEPLAEISGRVVSEKTGKGIEGILVRFHPVVPQVNSVVPQAAEFLKWGKVKTDATGRFTFYCKGDENYLLGFDQSITAEEGSVIYYQKYGPFSEENTVRVAKYQKVSIPDVAMNESVRLRTEVTDEKGKALATPFEAFLATKQLTNLDADRPQIRTAKGFSLEQGAVVIPQLDPDSAMAILVRKGNAVNNPEFLVPSVVPRPRPILISDEWAATVRGNVVDAEGMPVKHAQVRLLSGQILLEEMKSTAEGKFEFAGLWPGLHYRIAAETIKDEQHYGSVKFHTIIGHKQQSNQKLDDLKIVLKLIEKRQ